MPKHFSSQRMHRTGKLHYLELLREAEALESQREVDGMESVDEVDLTAKLVASLDLLYGVFMCATCSAVRVTFKGQVCFTCRRGTAA